MATRPPRRSALAARSPFEAPGVAPEAAEAPVSTQESVAAPVVPERAVEAPAAAPTPALALVPQEPAAAAPAAAPAPQVQPAPEAAVPAAQPAAAPAPVSATAELPKKKQSFYLEDDEADQMRGAYRATAHLEGYTSLTHLIARAVAAEVHRLQVQHNGGRPFPSLGVNKIPKGRPLSS